MPYWVGLIIVLLGLGIAAIGLSFIKGDALCAPGESHIVCVRSWLSAVGPIVGAIALLIAFGQFYLARENGARQLRAYVGIVPTFREVAGRPIEENPKSLVLTVDNQGQTPAYSVVSHLNFQWVPFGQSLPSDFQFVDYGTGIAGSAAVLQSKKDIGFTIYIDPALLPKARAKEIALFFYGYVKYRDTFDVSHISRFAYQYFPVEKDEKFVAHSLLMIDRFNDAD